MVETKVRNILFDNIKGFVIFSVVLVHALEWYTSTSTVMSYVHDLIYQFSMAMFIFISGFFSKDVKRVRERIVPDLIIPYIIVESIYVVLLYFATDQQKFNILVPQFAFWFLVSLAFYRGFLAQLVKIKWILPIMIIAVWPLALMIRSGLFWHYHVL
jgi:fucose 4-O-acetylase-like acetyltransferase